VLRWQAEMCTADGPPSVGYTALHTGVGGARRALLEAKEALTRGERLLGAGHASSFAHVCIRALVSRVDDDPTLRELRARLLGPMLLHDQSHKNDLLPTLQTYLDTGCRTVQTAELLGVHRNSVLYRLQRIVELSHVDLEDADTRWLLQLALQSATVRPELRSDDVLHTREADLVWSRVDPLEVAAVWTSELAGTGVHVES
jgi:purine catabolism regulator